jgi:hypothetical protein
VKIGVPAPDVVLMLLHSLFGTWRGPYPDDLDEVARACVWTSLKHVDMHLPCGVLKAARRSRRRAALMDRLTDGTSTSHTANAQND